MLAYCFVYWLKIEPAMDTPHIQLNARMNVQAPVTAARSFSGADACTAGRKCADQESDPNSSRNLHADMLCHRVIVVKYRESAQPQRPDPQIR